MPTISMFYGIVVRIYCGNKKHYSSHIYAFYNGYQVIVNINTLEIMEGTFPKRQQQFLFAWILLHQDELKANARLAYQGEKPFQIEPLR